MDKRLKNSEPALLWDYRRAKTLLDLLALYPMGSIEMDAALAFLSIAWLGDNPKSLELDTKTLIQVLAKHCLEAGKDNVAERQGE
jgi:hypothetical protein